MASNQEAPQPDRVLFRVVRREVPSVVDFQSDQERGKPIRPAQRSDRRLYTGISTFETASMAAAQARAWGLGRWIAELTISPDAPVIITKTRGPGHYTLEARVSSDKAALLRSFVSRVFAVESVG